MKKSGALKWLLGTKTGATIPKNSNYLSDFDHPVFTRWQTTFSTLPPPHTRLEAGSYCVKWNKLLRSRAGLCKPHQNLIELNPHLLKADSEIEATLVHELCHLSVSRRFWRPQPHGLHWQKLMIHCGFEPKRCHNLEGARVYKQKRHEMICSCGKHQVTTRVFNKISRGTNYKCLKCKTVLIHP